MRRLAAAAIVVACYQLVVEANDVTGEPFVSCAADAMYVKLKTKETFYGQIHVKFAPNRFCYQVLVTNNQIEVLIPHLDCKLNRRRLPNHQLGLVIEASILVAFDPEVITAHDRLFNLECYHTPATKTSRKVHPMVLDVGSPTPPSTETMHEEAPPDCSYRILDSGTGLRVGRVEVGDEVLHEWSCRNADTSCIFVRNCSLVTADSRRPLIDGEGCSTNTRLVSHLSYMNQSWAGVNMSVFGVVERPLVHFECELLLMPPGSDGFCSTPSCPRQHGKRKRRNFNIDDEKAVRVFDVRSQHLEISELPRGEAQVAGEVRELHEQREECPTIDPDLQARQVQPDGTICVSHFSFGAVAGATIFVAICTLVVVLVAMLRRSSRSEDLR